MSRDKQMINDLIEIFDEEYGKRNLITPQNTAEKLTAKGYRNASEVAREIFEEIDEELGGLMNTYHKSQRFSDADVIRYARCLVAELKKKHTKEE